MTDERGREPTAQNAPEGETLLSFLEGQRATFAWKTGGVDQAGMNKALPPSTLTLGGLVEHLERTNRRGEPFTLRWVVLHMIEEYARHLGHVDLIRESIDGLVGEWGALAAQRHRSLREGLERMTGIEPAL